MVFESCQDRWGRLSISVEISAHLLHERRQACVRLDLVPRANPDGDTLRQAEENVILNRLHQIEFVGIHNMLAEAIPMSLPFTASRS